MFICYPMIYDMTMLSLVSYMKILIEWKYPVYPDSILNLSEHVDMTTYFISTMSTY
jgi:hypothetical protein